MQAAQKAAAEKPGAKEDDEPPLDETGVSPEHIPMVMEHTGCTRNMATKTLRETNNDMINAVMKLS